MTAPPTAVMAAISCIGPLSSPKGAAYRHDPDVDWQPADSIKFRFSGNAGPLCGGATSLRAIAAGLNEGGIPTPRGNGQWSAVQVQRTYAESRP
jgi:hypothetical protein